jgi:hypothetical protein
MKNFYFIHYVEGETPPHKIEECVNLNEVGWLCVGSAPFVEGLMGDPNTYASYEEALLVLQKIRSILGYPLDEMHIFDECR